MEQIDIRKEMAAAIGRSNRQHKDIAISLGTTGQNLSNILNDKKRAVPTKWLIYLARELDDTDFKMIVADEILNLGLYTPAKSINFPLARKTMMDKEQSERESLDSAIAMIFSKPINDWLEDDMSLVERHQKELREEIASEINYLESIDQYIKHKLCYLS